MKTLVTQSLLAPLLRACQAHQRFLRRVRTLRGAFCTGSPETETSFAFMESRAGNEGYTVRAPRYPSTTPPSKADPPHLCPMRFCLRTHRSFVTHSMAHPLDGSGAETHPLAVGPCWPRPNHARSVTHAPILAAFDCITVPGADGTATIRSRAPAPSL